MNLVMYCLMKLAGGRAKDLVIVTSPRERQQTLQQGFAITQSRHLAGQWLTTIGGYFMPPIMLLIGLALSHYQIPSFFIFTYLLIFIYFLILTSRKGFTHCCYNFNFYHVVFYIKR